MRCNMHLIVVQSHPAQPCMLQQVEKRDVQRRMAKRALLRSATAGGVHSRKQRETGHMREGRKFGGFEARAIAWRCRLGSLPYPTLP